VGSKFELNLFLVLLNIIKNVLVNWAGAIGLLDRPLSLPRLSRSPLLPLSNGDSGEWRCAASGWPGRRRPRAAPPLASAAPPFSPPSNPRRPCVRLRLLRAPELTLACLGFGSPTRFRAVEFPGCSTSTPTPPRRTPTSTSPPLHRPRAPSRARAPPGRLVLPGPVVVYCHG
jgi:hypothetical protein